MWLCAAGLCAAALCAKKGSDLVEEQEVVLRVPGPRHYFFAKLASNPGTRRWGPVFVPYPDDGRL